MGKNFSKKLLISSSFGRDRHVKFITLRNKQRSSIQFTAIDKHPQGGHSTVKNTGGWLDSLGSEILVGKDILGFFKNTDLDNS